ncbi:glutamyl-tRNA reductase [Micropruina sonneratiae]|uniref:glutamyl-tRNA reductase n=1 Tax=Micropruina sonneratiae TaxID=2986940 RepID=UPI002227E194|nr:glutamyl-tRNA reductase [Micropruina sp. KQZ13P-5]MCW3159354.1 glutamyl-tRNA reductase [Micropruina sp. KQZ13P-5]
MLLCLTASHRSHDFTLLESLSGGAGAVLAESLLAGDDVAGGIVLGTCNRFEVYLDAAPEAVGALASQAAPLSLLTGEDAARHLFAVAAGLESVVVGEPEIAGQVRRALNTAEASATATPLLSRVFSDALATRRNVRERTGLGSARPSLIRLALDLASHRVTDWPAMKVLLVGTGRYASSCIEALRDRGVSAITVWSPSGRGHDFGARRGLDQVSGHAVAAAASRADVIVCCTTSSELVIGPELLEGACPVTAHAAAQCPVGHPEVGERHRVVIDLGLPRNVDPAVADLPGVELLDLEAIKLHAPLQHLAVADDAEAMVRQAAAAHADDAQQIGPAVAALRSHVTDTLEAEIGRIRHRYDEATADAAEAALRHFAGVLLHKPSVRARELARSGRRDEFVDGLHAVFGIDRPA